MPPVQVLERAQYFQDLAKDPAAQKLIVEYLGYSLDRFPSFDIGVSVRCPFPHNHAHGDKDASARLGLNKNHELTFKCFVCGFSMTATMVFWHRETDTEPREPETIKLTNVQYAHWTSLLLLRSGAITPMYSLQTPPASAVPTRHRGLLKDPVRARTLLRRLHQVIEESLQVKAIAFPGKPQMLSARYLQQRLGKMRAQLNEVLACRDVLVAAGILTVAGMKPCGKMETPLFMAVWGDMMIQQKQKPKQDEIRPEPNPLPYPGYPRKPEPEKKKVTEPARTPPLMVIDRGPYQTKYFFDKCCVRVTDIDGHITFEPSVSFPEGAREWLKKVAGAGVPVVAGSESDG